MRGLYEMAIKTYGMQAQIDVAIEEMAELTKALLKTRRVGGGSIYNVAEEIADVEIMLEQLKLIFNCENELAVYRGAKLARLKDRLQGKLEACHEIKG